MQPSFLYQSQSLLASMKAMVTPKPTAGLLILITWFLIVACGNPGETPGTIVNQVGPLRVVTTTALLADLVRNVGGDLVEVRAIVPAGTDMHSFQSTPGDSVAISRAQVIVSNGFGLDTFLEPVLRSAKAEHSVAVIASEGLKFSISHGTGSQDGGTETGKLNDARGPLEDPHMWQNPVFAINYVERIRDGLTSADSDRRQEYVAKAETYIKKLEELDREITKILAQVPLQRRHLVTFHNAFSHFAQHYGWKVSAFVDSDADEADPADVVRIMDQVKTELLPAVFVEPQFHSDVIRRAADDAGVKVWPIHSDIADTEVTSYTEMMRFNARTLAKHLR